MSLTRKPGRTGRRPSLSSGFPLRALDRMRGFTLLEMLVVMALIAAVAGLALPNFMHMYDSYAASLKWSELTAEVDGLPFRAYSQGREIQLNDTSAREVLKSLPPAWKVRVTGTIRYRSNGWCEGGTLSIADDAGANRDLVLAPPDCGMPP